MSKKKKNHSSLEDFGSVLDMMLQGGHNKIIGNDFILERNNSIGSINADIGHLNPEALNTFDQKYIHSLISLKAKEKVSIPSNIKELSEEYVRQRNQISKFHNKAFEYMMLNYDIEASQELGNYDDYINKVVLRNEAETNTFYDYITLYRKIDRVRAIGHWIKNNPSSINKQNRAVVEAFKKARFSILRLEENLKYGVIRVLDIISKKEMLLIDNALNKSKKEGLFFICSLLDMGEYVMTSGCGTPLDPYAPAGKSALSLSHKYIIQLRKAKTPLNADISKCVAKMYGLCIRGGALEGMIVN